MKLRGATVILTIIMASLLFIIPASNAVAAIDTDDISWTSYENDIEINAGSVRYVDLEIVNHLPYLVNDLTNDRMVTIIIDSPDHVGVSIDQRSFALGGQERTTIRITLDVWEFEPSGNYDITIHMELVSPLTGERTSTIPETISFKVVSSLSSGDAYNRILGIFENPLPEPFNTPLFSAVFTFLIWVFIGILLFTLLAPVILRLLLRNREEERDELKAELKTFLPFVLILFAFSSSLRVYGAPEELIAAAENWFNVFYIVLGAIIIWRLYLVFVEHTTYKLSDNKGFERKNMDIGPLLKLLGKLVIAVMSVCLIFSTLGFDLTAIITSAGIVSLGITFGAQNILSQFFSGMVLLITRPFKSGDLVRIGANGSIYKVCEVNIMNTVFDNWDNEEKIIMPNNVVSSSTIANLTGDGLIYKITVFVTISYKNDVDIAKKLMVEAAMSNPRIIKDGSVDRPYARLTAFEDSSIQLRLAAHVYDFNDSSSISGELREAIFELFKKNDISMPYPQMDVHLDVVDNNLGNKDKKDRKNSDS